MSRSYRNSPMRKMVRAKYKSIANDYVRDYEGIIPNGCFFKRIFPSSDIWEHLYVKTEQENKLELENILNNACHMRESYRADKVREEIEKEPDHRNIRKHLDYVNWYKFYMRK